MHLQGSRSRSRALLRRLGTVPLALNHLDQALQTAGFAGDNVLHEKAGHMRATRVENKDELHARARVVHKPISGDDGPDSEP